MFPVVPSLPFDQIASCEILRYDLKQLFVSRCNRRHLLDVECFVVSSTILTKAEQSRICLQFKLLRQP